MQKPVLVIMAAGMGSRYGGLKQIDPVGPGGQIILDYSIYDAHRVGFERVVFIIRPELHEAFERAIGQKARRFMQVEYAYQTLDRLPAGLAAPAGRKSRSARRTRSGARRSWPAAARSRSLTRMIFMGRTRFGRLCLSLVGGGRRKIPLLHGRLSGGEYADGKRHGLPRRLHGGRGRVPDQHRRAHRDRARRGRCDRLCRGRGRRPAPFRRGRRFP